MKVADMHCDTIGELYERSEKGEAGSILKNDLHIDLEKMEEGDYLLQNFALYTNLKKEAKPFEYGMMLVDRFYTELEAHADRIGIVRSWADIEANQKAGRMSAMLTLEEGGVCQGNLAFLRDFYRMGARMMTLTWNYENELGYSNKRTELADGSVKYVPDTEHGLTERGIAFVQEMERLGMIVDISHLNDAGIWDVFRHTTKPFVASHSNARSLASHPRNLTDDMIRALSERGGVTGINFCAAFLRDDENGVEPTHSCCADMVRHMKYIKQIGGIGCIGLGSDFDGFPSTLEMKNCSGMQMLADEMTRQGFTTGEIEAVFHGNVLRVYKEILR
ncbi:MAG: dipeptidase [Lachnospiraceae bacterium]|nr:dipeptidase [Lachnospiraceae bacterium]